MEKTSVGYGLDGKHKMWLCQDSSAFSAPQRPQSIQKAYKATAV